MELLTKIVVLAIGGLIIWAIWHAGGPRRVFVVRIKGGEPRAVAGTVTPALLERVREVAANHAIATGQVCGMQRGTRISLTFSRQFPGPACQQLRNWWAMSGWAASSGHA